MTGMALARSPDLYPQKLDLIREAAMVIPMDLAAYRAASFLDDRILTSATRVSWAPLSQLADAARAVVEPRKLNFIFHTGHVGSTLLSRVLDETGVILGLREPLPLRTLAEAHDVLGSPEALLSKARFDAILDMFLRLWSRGYPTTQSVVIKATSTSARLASALMAARPDAHAVYLNLAPEPYLATLLAGPNAVFDMRAFGPERIGRLRRLVAGIDPVLHTLSLGELAAMTWLTERLTQVQLQLTMGERVLALDFEQFLANRSAALTAVLAHFSVATSPQTGTRLANSTAFTRYSKAPEQYAYTDAVRTQALTQARRDHAFEIGKGLAWLERNGKASAIIAAVL